MRRIIYLGISIFLISGCERDRLSPVEIKIDEDVGYTAIGDIALEATHVMSGGETLFDVANKYNVDPMNLAKINGIKPPYNVKNGQILRLPTENLPVQDELFDEEKSQKDESSEKAVEKLEKELDEEFAGVMSIKGKATAGTDTTAAASVAKKRDANVAENVLSTPKVTQTAIGTEPTKKPVEKVKPSVSAPSKMICPVNGKIVSRFGDVSDGVSNDGINIKAALGTPVKASANGEVIYTGNKLEEFGNTVIIKHDNDVITSYAHLNKIDVKNGATVKQGDVIGAVGKTGDVTEPQLHFEVLKSKMPVNPSKYLD
ncbi:MAG: M23 family metallopeptidase [Holosporaceae bacterium]|jgi:murein DD-endopeptidase MepM/ murein hydrolase activator NlpD|nr:M23 family metallopeptidase [Holosporaceae bacterium]